MSHDWRATSQPGGQIVRSDAKIWLILWSALDFLAMLMGVVLDHVVFAYVRMSPGDCEYYRCTYCTAFVYCQCTFSDLIRDIRDPEKPETLEELNIVCEDGVKVKPLNSQTCVISVEFSPTVQHCSLATLIGLYNAVLRHCDHLHDSS